MAFGTDTDYFGLGDTHWKIQGSGITPSASNDPTPDENGDNICEVTYDEFNTYQASYRLIGVAADTQTIDTKVKVGQIFPLDTTARAVVNSIEIATSNTENPLITVQAEQYFGDTGGQLGFANALTVLPIKRAQGLGVTADTVSRIISSSATITGQTYRVLDSDGDPAQSDLSGGRAEASAELISCTANPGVAAASGWTLVQAVARSSENTRQETASINVYKNLTRA